MTTLLKTAQASSFFFFLKYSGVNESSGSIDKIHLIFLEIVTSYSANVKRRETQVGLIEQWGF